MGQYANIDTLTAFAQKIKEMAVRDKTEAQALVLSTSHPDYVYYTSDTHCIVKNGQIYGRGEQIVASNFAFLPASEQAPGLDPTFTDTTKIYVQPDTATPGNFKLWWCVPGTTTWVNGGSFPLDIPLTAEDISYDLTPTPDLGTGDVQSAIEAEDAKVEQLSLDTMGKDESGEYWEDELHEVYGYSVLSNNHRIGANYAGTSASGYYIFIFPSSEGDVWKVEKAAGSGRWEGFWKGGTAYSSITAANHLQSWQQASGTFTAPADTTLFAVVTNTANLQLTSVWRKTTRPAKTPADIQRQLIELEAGCINTSALEVGEVIPYWAAASTVHGIRLEVRKGQVLLLDLVGTATYAPLVFTDEDRVITEIHQTPVYGAFEVPNDGYAYIQKLISHESDNYLYIMGYGGHAKDMADNRVARDELQAQFDALYRKGVADGAGMASIAGLGYNVYDHISGEIDLEGFDYGCRYRHNSIFTPITGTGNKKWQNNTHLVYFPKVDLTGLTPNGYYSFDGCSNLVVVPDLTFSAGSASGHSMFRDCKKLIHVGNIIGFQPTTVLYMFSGDNVLKSVGKIDTSKISASDGFHYIFNSCNVIERCEGLDLTSAPNIGQDTFYYKSNRPTMRYFLLTNLGKNSANTIFNMTRTTNWGVATASQPDARQSVIDTLITYSFDRAAANEEAKQAAIDAGTYDEETWTDPYGVITISLATNTKALLTDEEIEQITAKGYTIA